jgi:hypothetical protein
LAWLGGPSLLLWTQDRAHPAGPGVTDPSILQSVMPHQVAHDDVGDAAGAGAGVADNANPGAGAGGAGNAPKRHMLTHSPAACMLAGPMYLTWKQPGLGRIESQAWFCQQLGLEPPCLAPYAGQPCSCGRFTIDADHLHTCTQHSGNWYAAHERLLTVVSESAFLFRSGCMRRQQGSAPSTLRRRRGINSPDEDLCDPLHRAVHGRFEATPARILISLDADRDPRVFCASRLPNFLARWRVRGRPAGRGPAGTGSVGDGVGEGSAKNNNGATPYDLTADFIQEATRSDGLSEEESGRV